MSKILMVVPTEDAIDAVTSLTCARLSTRADVEYIAVKGRPSDYSRNCAIRLFLAHPDFTHLFFLDSDIGLPLDAIDRLLALDTPLASGCYPVSLNGLRWALSNKQSDGRYRLLEWLPSEDEPFPIDAGGAGCLLIRRDVFDKVKWPWFKWIEHEDGGQMSEDIYFFQKANNAGLRVVVDPHVITNHFKKINLTELMRLKMKNRKENKCGSE